MKFSLSWLRTWINLQVSLEDLLAKLTMAGLEVEAVTPVAHVISGVVVGLVESVEPHPNADKLRICRVSVSDERSLSIVCGASNVVPGMKVPTALMGAKLGPDFVIKPAKLRGVDSEGMLCSATELGLAEVSDGLMLLPQDAPLGQDIVDYLDLRDVIIELDLTPNRSDCLSIRGLAREIAAIYQLVMIPKTVSALTPHLDYRQHVVLQDSSACPRYACQYLEIATNEPSPIWLVERLRRSGIRSVHPVVDITQYVMLEVGQPLHAFDADKLQGELCVRFALHEESLTLLDGKTVTLTPSMLVIADASGAIAVAGVMGGLATGVTPATKRILLESAYFHPNVIAGTARQLGVQTDAAHRFERGVDVDAVSEALTRACLMIHEHLGGAFAPLHVIEDLDALSSPIVIDLAAAQVKAVLGFMPELPWIKTALISLGLQCIHEEHGYWQWRVPSYRHDLKISVDLIEEIARLYGYDTLPAQVAKRSLTVSSLNETMQRQYACKRYLQSQGFHEAICYSFVSESLEAQLNANEKPYALVNPISPELAVMRTTLWGGLLLALKYNWNRQQSRIRLFELGSIFLRKADTLQQPQKLAGLALGSALPEQWGEAARKVDFYDMKALLQPLLPEDTEFRLGGHTALHPGRSASLYRKGQSHALGAVGELHPSIAAALDLPEGIYLFELDMADIDLAPLSAMMPFGKFPLIRRDLAFLVDKKQPIGLLLEAAKTLSGQFVKQVALFDVYQGERIAEDKQSIALRLTLQADDKTLTDDEVNQIVDKVIQGLSQQFSAQLRE